ncbi:glycosyltransferase family 4 protein [Patescibacteria group bacterium]|nr:glycosyltransferase family 4 protein [Patescibacteria group bacterium]MBU1868059.1 glycosyltransferase family 4 protein [Patescibacteria group bacterium]
MKIGLVCPYRLQTPGGVSEHVRALAKELRLSGHQATVISPGFGVKKIGESSLYVGRAVKVPSPNKSWSYVSVYVDTSLESLRKIIDTYNFDIIHFHEPLAPFLCWQVLKVSTAVNVATFHSEWALTADSFLVDSLQFLLNPLLPRFKEKLAGVIAVSEVARRSWSEVFDGSISEIVIPNGVSLSRFKPQNSPLRVFGDKPTILYVGRVEARKGLHYLIDAFRLLEKGMPEVRLVVVGAGPLLAKHKLWVLKNNLADKVFFAGRVPGQGLPSYYRGADVFCSPATGGESFGIVLLESMASGTPLVVFDNPGYGELLQRCPWPEVLATCRNTQELSDKLKEMLTNSRLRKKVRQWGLKEVRNYEWSRITKKVIRFYDEIMEKHS